MRALTTLGRHGIDEPWRSADAPRADDEASQAPMPHEPQDAPSSTHEVPDALRRALVSAAERRDYSSDVLHAEVCNYVRDLRARGLPPEAVVIAVKHAVRESTMGLAPYRAERRHSSDLVERVVRWCIEEYFDGTGG